MKKQKSKIRAGKQKPGKPRKNPRTSTRSKAALKFKKKAAAKSLYSRTDSEREISLAYRAGKNPEPFRTPWRRDYARIIHSPVFRRLQGKTQLFPGTETDFFRNRLTHSLEVAQIAKSIAIRINNTVPFFKNPKFKIDTDLVEAAGLGSGLTI